MSDLSSQNDLRAIQAFNQRHIQAWLSSDADAVISLWSDDFTVIHPVGPAVRGRSANVEMLQKGMGAASCCESFSGSPMVRGKCIVRSPRLIRHASRAHQRLWIEVPLVSR